MNDLTNGFLLGFAFAFFLFSVVINALDADPKVVKTETVVYTCQPQ